MFVRDYMTRHPMMAEPDMPAVDAQRLMAEARIRRLPVVGDGKRLLGLVTRQSLLVDPGKLGSLNMWDIAGYLSGLTLKDVMLKAERRRHRGPGPHHRGSRPHHGREEDRLPAGAGG